MQIDILTKADLKALLEEHTERLKVEILEMLKGINTENSRNTENDLMTIEETCKYLKITRTTLHHWTNIKRIKSYKMQGRVYYKRSEVEQAMI